MNKKLGKAREDRKQLLEAVKNKYNMDYRREWVIGTTVSYGTEGGGGGDRRAKTGRNGDFSGREMEIGVQRVQQENNSN